MDHSSKILRPLKSLLSANNSKSLDWFNRAKRVLAGGVNSSARASSTGPLPYPQYILHGQGSHITDADGNDFIDCFLGYGCMILGHANRSVGALLSQQVETGTMFGACNTVEVELAEKLCAMSPCVELVRFANSGSEAIIGAIRLSRGYTGRSKVIKFEGHYHGWVDVLAVSNRPRLQEVGPLTGPFSQPHSRGIPSAVVGDVIICPWNEPQILKQILDQHDGEIAAIIAEPIVGNNACIMPAPGYLEFLRYESTKRHIILIFDEVVTGFRVAPGGAQELFGIQPDLAVFGKALSGGLPISAFGGRREIMELIATDTVRHGGTYNGNPLCASAALHTLQVLSDPQIYTRLSVTGEAIIHAIRTAAAANRIKCAVLGPGSMFQVIFGIENHQIRQYRDLLSADMDCYAAFRHSLLESGVYVTHSGFACWFVSAAHTDYDVQLCIDAIKRAMKALS